jgi:hypothetical protein
MTAHTDTNCGAVAAPNAVTTTTISSSTTTIVSTMLNCHWECQNTASCKTFSFNTDTNTCTLHTATCKLTGTDTNTSHFAKNWFEEAGFETLDVCTHQSYFDQDPLKVAACKEHSTEANCEG